MKSFDRTFVVAVCLLALVVSPVMSSASGVVSSPKGAAIVVFAASSLTDALQEVGDDYTRSAGVPVKFSFAASSALARQIESGAPADAFVSADVEWMDYLQSRNLVIPSSRLDLLGNRLVLVAPAATTLVLKIGPHFPLGAALGTGHLVTGDPDSVPVGRYAKAALSSLGVWNDIAPRLVRADNVRSALAFVDRGEAQLGIVYATDALSDKAVRIVDTFPESTHAPIVYPAALGSAAQPGSDKFIAFLLTPEARAVFVKYGFVPLR